MSCNLPTAHLASPPRPRVSPAAAIARSNLQACLDKIGDLSFRHAVNADVHQITARQLDEIERDVDAGFWMSAEQRLGQLRNPCELLSDRRVICRALSLVYGALSYLAAAEGTAA